MTLPQSTSSRQWYPYLLLAGTVATLGFNWPLLAIGLRDISPMWLATMRLSGAAVVVFVTAAVTNRLERPPRADLPVLVSFAFGRLILVMVLVFIALRLVPPGRSSVLVWTASLWTVPMAAAFLGERMTRRRWIGLGAGLMGIVLLVEPWSADIDGSLVLGYGLLLLAAIAHAATAVHVRGHQWVSTPLGLLPWQVAGAAVPLAVVTFAIEGVPDIPWSWRLVGIVAYQCVLATGFATWAQLTALRRLPAVPTNLTLMLVPVVGLLSSAVVVGDRLTTMTTAGTAMIVLGVLTGTAFERRTRVESVLE